MKKQELEPIANERLKITLKNGIYYSGKIISLNETSLLFKDKFGSQILIDFESIASVLVFKGGVENGR